MSATTSNENAGPNSPLPRTTPESEGVSSDAILAFMDAAEAMKLELHSLMLLRRGKVLAEGWWAPYSPERRHMLYSLSKSFLSTAAGLAIEEGFFTLDDTVVSFFPDDVTATINKNLAAMQVRHLLSMATGHAEDQTGALRGDPDGNWVRAFLAQPVEHEPGTYLRYNSAATYMVSAILQKTTGVTALDFLQPRLLEPLGITDATWENDPKGISVGGWGLSIRTDEIARFGELYRRRGVWNDQPLIPSDWVDTATRAQVANGDQPDSDWQQGYGYQFWRCRHGAYRADGAFGQFCVVMPRQEAVFVTTANVADMPTVLSLVWEKLLPALTTTSPLPANELAQERLHGRLSHLHITAPEGAATSETAARITGLTYRFAENDQEIKAVSVKIDSDFVTLRIEDAAGSHTVAAGLGDWKSGMTTFLQSRILRSLPRSEGAGDYQLPCVAFAAWTEENSLTLRLCLVETPFTPIVVLTFVGEKGLRFALEGRIGFGPSERPVLEGIAE